MLNEVLMEQRLSAVEEAVAELRRRLPEAPAPADWLDKVIGSVTDEAAFLEALDYGRAYRATNRLADEADGES